MDPIQHFDEDLKDLIDTKIQENHNIILMGDFNIPINKQNKFTKMLSELGLHKVITQKYKPTEEQATYKYGKTIIDGI